VHSYPDCQNGASPSETAFEQFVSAQFSKFAHCAPERSDWREDDSVGVPHALSLNGDGDVRTSLGQRLDQLVVRFGRFTENHDSGAGFGIHLLIVGERPHEVNLHTSFTRHSPQTQRVQGQRCHSVTVNIRSYVAIGDSLSEGMGDRFFLSHRVGSGWTDRLAHLLATDAADRGESFEYANIAIRGSKLEDIMDDQLEHAIALRPDLVTILAGSNNFFSNAESVAELERVFRAGLRRLKIAGIHVVVANTINPCHLRFFGPVRPNAKRMSAMIDRVAAELGFPVIDVYGMAELEHLEFWHRDMVHFSEIGHTQMANAAAALLETEARYTPHDYEPSYATDRPLGETVAWFLRDVVPFIDRRLRRTSSGVGISPKLPALVPWSLVPEVEDYLRRELVAGIA
jgi:lysophospholipase L1-like esterase